MENAVLISSTIGGLFGMTKGYHEATRHSNGYIWRPVVYGVGGFGLGIFTGVHYKKVVMLVIGADLIKSGLSNSN